MSCFNNIASFQVATDMNAHNRDIQTSAALLQHGTVGSQENLNTVLNFGQ